TSPPDLHSFPTRRSSDLDYPNMYADMSAGSGLNALLRDEDHARAFLKRQQNKLLYGSDCNDRDGAGEKCSGSQQIAAIRRLAPRSEEHTSELQSLTNLVC